MAKGKRKKGKKAKTVAQKVNAVVQSGAVELQKEEKKIDGQIESLKKKKTSVRKKVAEKVEKKAEEIVAKSRKSSVKMSYAGIAEGKARVSLQELSDWMIGVQAFGLDRLSPETLRRYLAKVKIGDKCASRIGKGEIKKRWSVRKKCFVTAIQKAINKNRCKLTKGKKSGLTKLRCRSKK